LEEWAEKACEWDDAKEEQKEGKMEGRCRTLEV
jgi:hypothetical protein